MVLLNEYHTGRLHRTVHLQVDGGSDARGFVVVELLGVLCALGVVDCVIIASLIPGHTHEDIDALFSVLTKSLKTRSGERCSRTWNEIMVKATEVYPGWTSKVSRKPGPIGVADIPFVWRFKEAFGQGDFPFRSSLSPNLVGLFGTGRDHEAKPSRFEIRLGVSGRPVVTAFLSSVPGAAMFSSFDQVEIFAYCPRLEALGFHNLREGWDFKHGALMASLQRVDSYSAGYTTRQVEEMAAMTCAFADPPPNAVFFGKDLLTCVGWKRLVALGLSPERGRRAAQGGGGEPARKRRASGRNAQDDGDELDSGLEYHSDENDGGEEEEEEAGELSSSGEESAAESVFDGEDFVIEEWLDRRFNDVEQQDEFLLKFCGYDEPEWTLRRRLLCRVPQKIADGFDLRDEQVVRNERQERKKRLFREHARWAAGDADDGGDNDLEAGPVASVSAPVPAAPIAAASVAAAPNSRAHLRRSVTKK